MIILFSRLDPIGRHCGAGGDPRVCINATAATPDPKKTAKQLAAWARAAAITTTGSASECWLATCFRN